MYDATSGSDVSSVMSSYGMDENIFFNTNASIFASIAYIVSRYPEFEYLTTEEKRQVIQNAVSYNMNPWQEVSMMAEDGGGETTNAVSINQVAGCLTGALFSYVVDNWALAKAIYQGITGSSMGWSFVVGMAKNILKTSLQNAGGIWGIAMNFAFCLLW